MLPQVGSGSVMPRFRKLSRASVRIAVGTSRVHRTISGSTALSSTCWMTTRRVEAPRARAASTYSRSRMARIVARDTREARDDADADGHHNREQVVAEDGDR